MYCNGQKETQNSPVDWPRLLGNFVDLPGASRIEILPDIEAFNEPGADHAGYDVESVSRWESEGGKIIRPSMPPRDAVSAFGTDRKFR